MFTVGSYQAEMDSYSRIHMGFSISTFFFFLVGLGFNSELRTCKASLSYISSLFCSGYFGDGILQTICPG
jgi:hypothetical protein